MTLHKNISTSVYKDNIVLSGDLKDDDGIDIVLSKLIGTDYSFKHRILWIPAISFLFMHVFALWGLFIALTGGANYKTIVWTCILIYACIESATVGAHRLFSHRSFKVTPALKAIIIFFFTMSGQNSLFTWCQGHRLHHRYTDTDGDPHNSMRGLFFSHIGWLMTTKHPRVLELEKKIDISDIKADWMIMFQKKYYFYLHFLIAFTIPVGVPYYFFGETFKNSILISYFTRYVADINPIFFVNSFGHRYGTRPYDKKLLATDSWFASSLSLGEGWHNYHHAFPWDYKAAELKMFNPSASLIRFFERIGLAYDLKSASPEMVKNRMIRTGDGTQHYKTGDTEDRDSVTAIRQLHHLNRADTIMHKIPNKVFEYHGLPVKLEDTTLD